MEFLFLLPEIITSMSKKQIPAKPTAATAAIPDDGNALRRLKISLGIIIGVFAFLLYAQSIAFNYTMDDHQVIDQNSYVKKGLAGIPSILKTDYLHGAEITEAKGPIYRPTCLVLFAIEWQFFPNNPHFYHFINVLLYALTCLLFYLLLCKLFEKQNLLFPFVCALLFVAHPIHSEVVNNIKSADEILCFLFGILSLFFILKAVSNKFNLYLILSGISFFLCAISKESGISFLIIIPLTFFVFVDSSRRKLFVISVVILAISAIYFLLRAHVLQAIRLNTSDSFIYNTVVAAPDFISRQATVFYILLKYIQLLVYPNPLTCDYNFQMIKVQSLSDFPAIIGIFVNLGLGIYALINLKKKSMISFGILYYYITIAPVSNMFILNGATMAERFLYTPSLGFCIIIGYLLIKLTKVESIKYQFRNLSQMISFNSKLFIILFTLIGLYSIKTFSRSLDWKDDITIYRHDVQISENSATAHLLWGRDLLFYLYPKEKDSSRKILYVDSAIIEFNKILNIFPNVITYRDLAYCFVLKKDYESSIYYYHAALMNENYSDSADVANYAFSFYYLGTQMNTIEQYDKAISLFDSAIKYKPDLSFAFNNKGAALLHQLKTKEALEEFEKAIKLDPSNQKAYTNIGCAYSNLGQFTLAIEYLNKSSKMDPTDPNPFYFLGITFQNMGDDLKAKENLEKANRLNGGQQK
jgi:tetratricopeptide (TPR) repeat protein